MSVDREPSGSVRGAPENSARVSVPAPVDREAIRTRAERDSAKAARHPERNVLLQSEKDRIALLAALEEAEAERDRLRDDWELAASSRDKFAMAAQALRARLDTAEGVIDAIDHATYGWSFATAVEMVDKIRLMCRAFLADDPNTEGTDD